MFELPQRAIEVRDQVADFFNSEVLPNNQLWRRQARAGQALPEIESELRAKARSLNLWNMALPRLADDEPGMGPPPDDPMPMPPTLDSGGGAAVLEPPSDDAPEEPKTASAEDIERLKRMFGSSDDS